MGKSVGQRRSQQQERRVATELGGKVQKASGAMEHAKGDVRVLGKMKVECKTTTQKSFSLTLAMMRKIRAEGMRDGGEGWAMQLEFKEGFTREHFAVIDWATFQQLLRDSEIANCPVRNSYQGLGHCETCGGMH